MNKDELQTMQAAFKRAAQKAVAGTREQRSGRFEPPRRNEQSRRDVQQQNRSSSIRKA
ncbi:MAG TPA: hypothetical protein VM029_05470 [Opitutaceae bacterium]|nr:hypothetical protein [Opitutaceae bacterium]